MSNVYVEPRPKGPSRRQLASSTSNQIAEVGAP
jgi:hypothetical protein